MMSADEKNQGVVQHLCRRLGSLMPRVERNAVFEVIRQDQMNLPPRSPDLRIDQITTKNLASISNFRDENVVGTFRKYLAEKDIGVYAYCDGLAVGHAWAGLWHGSKRLIWGYLPVDASTACIYFCSVSPSYRGRKIYQNMLVELSKLVFESTPVRRILIACAIDNLPSYSAIERVGFRRLLILPALHWCGHMIRFARIPEVEIDNQKVS